MDLLAFISDPDRKQALAEAVDRSPAYLWQLATGWRGKRASTDLAQAIERETTRIGPDGVPKHLLRPDVWDISPPASEGSHDMAGCA